ncbi:alpha/beta hydrolase [Nocardioides piscis]|uniref:Alpha/beta hydrolase n=1 Tax=Nocardioides piscis TaxID=2714938 RepID=A0A6G7YIZ1_9ACTN|nr:alpha/beta hydrolase [Nocardioides piscis]QIK76705.1 alpha/beta hydrolase [Nocardioides piscis]
MSYLRRQTIIAALTANAIRPIPGLRAGVPSFFAGWVFGELAPQMLALTAADTAAQAVRGKRSRIGFAAAALSAVGLVHLIRQSQQVKDCVEDALVEGLGVDYVEQLDAAPTPADLATPWRKLVNPFRFSDDRVQVEKNIAYAEFGRRSLLDIYRPAEVDQIKDAPVLLQVHGGGWTIGNKDQQGIPLMQHMAQRGWVCVAINYRLAPRDPFPAHVIDVKQAIAWVKEHIAEYGGNPDYVVITGGSAGGHLATLAAVTPNAREWQPGFEDADTSVQAAVPHYGVYDFAGSTGLRSAIGMRDAFLAPRILKKSWADEPEAFEAASPILRVDGDEPDFFILHGEADTLVDVGQARAFVEKLRKVSKKTVVYAELPGAQHAFDIFPSIRSAHVVRAIERYLGWHWNTWRAGLSVTADVSDVADAPEVPDDVDQVPAQG